MNVLVAALNALEAIAATCFSQVDCAQNGFQAMDMMVIIVMQARFIESENFQLQHSRAMMRP